MDLRLVTNDHDTIANWVGQNLGIPLAKPRKSIGVVDPDGTLIGGIVFTHFTGSNVEATVYGRGCFTRNRIRFAAQYVFYTLGYHRVTLRTRKDNKPVCKILSKWATFECVAPLYFGPKPGDSAVVYRLTREDAEHWCGAL